MNFYIYKTKDQRGTTLIELLVAISIFAMAIIMFTQIFQMVLESQRSSIASQNTQESMRFAFEMMSKEIRVALGAHDGNVSGNNACLCNGRRNFNDAHFKVFNTENCQAGVNEDIGTELYFSSKKDGDYNCVRYDRVDDGTGVFRLRVWKDWNEDRIINNGETGYLTPDEVNVNNIQFQIIDDAVGDFHSTQPLVVINMDVTYLTAKDLHKQNIVLQTAVSSRYYE